MIEGGRVVFSDTMEAFNNYTKPNTVLIRVENLPPRSALLDVTGVTMVDFISDSQVRVYFDGGQDIAERLVLASVQQGWRLREIGFEKGLPDETFKQLTQQTIF